RFSHPLPRSRPVRAKHDPFSTDHVDRYFQMLRGGTDSIEVDVRISHGDREGRLKIMLDSASHLRQDDRDARISRGYLIDKNGVRKIQLPWKLRPPSRKHYRDSLLRYCVHNRSQVTCSGCISVVNARTIVSPIPINPRLVTIG